MPQFVVGVGDARVGALSVEVSYRFRPAMHLRVFLSTHQHVRWCGCIAVAVRDHPTMRFVIILEEKRGDRSEDKVFGFQRSEVRVERSQRKPHHDFAFGLRIYLIDDCHAAKAGLRTVPVDLNELRVPTSRVHEIYERLEATFSSRHGRCDGESRHVE